MKTKKALPLILISAAGIATLAVAGCGKQTPVARVDVDPRKVDLPFSQLRTVHLTWTPSAAVGDEKPTVFVHLLDGKKKVARTFDHAFPERWRAGTPVSYDLKLYQSALAPPLSPGKYQVTLGLYGKDGKRWPLEGLGEPEGRAEYKAIEVEVPNANSRPRLAFSPNWMDVESGGDRQVLARRWLVDRGSIRLVDQRAPGSVWMVVQIPPTDIADYKLVLAEGASAPSVMIRGNCGSPETNLSGPGLHEVEVAVDAPPAGDFCHLLLSANFSLEPQKTSGKKRSASLENIAWIPGGGRGAQGRQPSADNATPTSQ